MVFANVESLKQEVTGSEMSSAELNRGSKPLPLNPSKYFLFFLVCKSCTAVDECIPKTFFLLVRVEKDR